MAKKTRKTSGTSKTKADPRDRIIDTALTLAAERGWRRLALAEIARAQGIGLSVDAEEAAYRRAADAALARCAEML